MVAVLALALALSAPPAPSAVDAPPVVDAVDAPAVVEAPDVAAPAPAPAEAPVVDAAAGAATPPVASDAARDVRVAVVVADLRDAGVGAAVSTTLTELVSFELSRIDAVDVVAYADVRVSIDLAAQRQLLGCETEDCLVDAGRLFDAPYLLHGSVAPSADGLVVTVSLVDTRAARVVGRGRQVVSGDEQAMIAAVRVVAVTAIAPLRGEAVDDEAALADVLARLRTRQRPKPWDAGVSASLVVPFTIGASPLLVTPGVSGVGEAAWAVLPWLSLGARGTVTWVYGSLPGSLTATGASGGVIRSATTAQAQWLNASAEALVRLRPSEGLALPFLEVGGGGGFASLELGDEIAARDDVPEFLQRQREAGSGASVNGFLSAGIDVLALDRLAVRLALDGSVAATALRQREFIGDAPKNDATELADEPVPPLVFVGVRLGVAWQG